MRLAGACAVLVGVVLTPACEGPSGVKAAGDASSSSTSATVATDTAVTAGTDTGGSLTSTSGDTTDTDSELPWPHELPEGCGDGRVVPGQYDCFRPVPLPDLSWPPRYEGADLDADGRDELLVRMAPETAEIVPMWLVGDTLVSGETVASNGGGGALVPGRFDLSGDGVHDVVGTTPEWSSQSIFFHENRGVEGLGPAVELDVTGGVLDIGLEVLVDPDLDGWPEVLVSLHPSLSPDGFRMRRFVGGEWTAAGPSIELPGCGWPSFAVHGDFDEDQVPDVVIIDAPTACKPYPPEYEPSFHRMAVLRSDPDTGTMQLHATVPTGAIWAGVGAWPYDADGDGHLDIVLNVSAEGGLKRGLAMARGRGDGTFHDAQLQLQLDSVSETNIFAIDHGDFDGDGDQELVLLTEEETWVVDDGLDPSTAVRVYPFKIQAAYTLSADVNGDGITDFIAADPFQTKPRWLMVSAP